MVENGTYPSLCRVCANTCPILVTVEDGRAVDVVGDPDGPAHHGYTCVKGRALPEFHNTDRRLLHSMKLGEDGQHAPIRAQDAIDEIADRLRDILAESGPRSVAVYAGTKLTQNELGYPLSNSFMDAIGSPMRFSSNTIDQPGKAIAKGLHGAWMAPPQAFDRPDVMLFVGINGLVSYIGLPSGDPGRFLKEAAKRGVETIVIDPRRTPLAARATLHLQPRPGEDVAILAGMLRVILSEGLHDEAFVAENVDGLPDLRAAVDAYTPEEVARRAGIPAEDLVRAARMFGGAKRGYGVAGTGPNMGTAQGTLFEYLLLVLDTVCGHYLRAGEPVRNPGTLIPTVSAKAQAAPPFPAYGFGAPMRFRGLANTLAGPPTALLPEEILTPGEGRIRALFVLGGNPVAAFPDQLLTIEAMKALDLLVTLDVEMSQTARLAHYVVAPKMALEVAATTQLSDMLMFYGNAFSGFEDAAGQYVPAVLDAPPGSDLIEEWELFYGVARRLGLPLELASGLPFLGTDLPPVELNMEVEPTSEQLLEVVVAGSRIPLTDVQRYPHGAHFPEPALVVQQKEPGWTGRLDVGNAEMMADLVATAAEPDIAASIGAGFRFRLISRRLQHVVNSSHNLEVTNRGRPYNPAALHPEDLLELGLAAGDLAEIRSAHGSIPAVIAADTSLRRGTVSMSHAFGGGPETDDEFTAIGSPTNRLLSVDKVYDRYSGQPLMSNVPVDVRPLTPVS
jgi:anaerobic selenocysteine-containing dehydrogenase